MGCALPGPTWTWWRRFQAPSAWRRSRRGCGRVSDAARLRQVIGARTPGLRLARADLDVDLTVVTTGPIPPAEAVAGRAELGEAAAIALSAVSDADAIRTAAGPITQRFARLAREVKAWARANGLDRPRSAVCPAWPGRCRPYVRSASRGGLSRP